MKEYITNQTTDVSVADIEEMLVGFGIKNLTKEYHDHALSAITFILPVDGHDLSFRLPVNIGAIEDRLKLEIRKPKSNSEYWTKLRTEAEKIAWHVIADWVDLQISLVKLGQSDLLGVMLPFVYNPIEKKTMYEQMKSNGIDKIPLMIKG